MSDSDRRAPRAVLRAATGEQRAVLHAQIVLRCADGGSIRGIVDELGVAIMTVRLLRARYAGAGIAGLGDAPRSGHPPTWWFDDGDQLTNQQACLRTGAPLMTS